MPSVNCRANGRAKSSPACAWAKSCARSIPVAAYIPSGRYPLFSTLMMTVIPAQVAGVPNICAASPRAVTELFGTAALLGVRQVFQMGGAQAIAAFAFGTKTVPRADRIVGPGNIYVAAAQEVVSGRSRH